MLGANLEKIRARIAAACERAGRKPEDIVIIAAAKYVDSQGIKEALEAGLSHIGENRVQDAVAKQAVVGKTGIWHMIGHLQTNKVKKALEAFDTIDSVDSLRLVDKINKEAESLGRTVEVLIEVNTSGEEAKYGVSPEGLDKLKSAIGELDNLKLAGLMTMAPLVDDPEKARHCFKLLKSLQGDLPRLSMGMSDDFEVAIEEGATEVRLGRVLFV